jgi:hypothetical protein
VDQELEGIERDLYLEFVGLIFGDVRQRQLIRIVNLLQNVQVVLELVAKLILLIFKELLCFVYKLILDHAEEKFNENGEQDALQLIFVNI